MIDRFLLHYSQKNPRNWRLRCMKKHPYDPGWESGTYEKCHPTIRPLHEKGDTIFDVVVKDKKPVIRSMFEIADIDKVDGESVWFFNEYYYAVGEPKELPGYFIKYRIMKLPTFLNDYNWDPIDYVKKHYRKYSKGEKPDSIKIEDWRKIQKFREKL